MRGSAAQARLEALFELDRRARPAHRRQSAHDAERRAALEPSWPARSAAVLACSAMPSARRCGWCGRRADARRGRRHRHQLDAAAGRRRDGARRADRGGAVLQITRLGAGVDRSRRLADDAIGAHARRRAPLRRETARRARRAGASGDRPPAPSATAANGAEFLARIQAETGFQTRLLPGAEEARLTRLGVLAGRPAARGRRRDRSTSAAARPSSSVGDAAAARSRSTPAACARPSAGWPRTRSPRALQRHAARRAARRCSRPACPTPSLPTSAAASPSPAPRPRSPRSTSASSATTPSASTATC